MNTSLINLDNDTIVKNVPSSENKTCFSADDKKGASVLICFTKDHPDHEPFKTMMDAISCVTQNPSDSKCQQMMIDAVNKVGRHTN